MEEDNTENFVKIIEDNTENVIIPEKKVIESDVKKIHHQTKPKARAFSAVLQAILGRALVDVARARLLYARQGCNAEGLEVKAAKTISGDRRANHLRGHLAHLSFMVARVFLLVTQIRQHTRHQSQ